VFELADRQPEGNIVQVFSEASNGNENLIATIFASPVETSKTPDKLLIRFDERPSGSPKAIHSWFYPGDNTGWQFVYPKG
jgi:hypothetical protein